MASLVASLYKKAFELKNRCNNDTLGWIGMTEKVDQIRAIVARLELGLCS